VNAQNLQSSVEAFGQFQLLVQDGSQQICRHGDPNLGFRCIQACSLEHSRRKYGLHRWT
jgi:hypothetical protein